MDAYDLPRFRSSLFTDLWPNCRVGDVLLLLVGLHHPSLPVPSKLYEVRTIFGVFELLTSRAPRLPVCFSDLPWIRSSYCIFSLELGARFYLDCSPERFGMETVERSA